MAHFIHPSKEDICLEGVLGALADPIRLQITQELYKSSIGCMSCTQASPCPKIAKSTLSNHFRILREAGIISTTKIGVEHRNTLRLDDLNSRFPNLLELILKLSEKNLMPS